MHNIKIYHNPRCSKSRQAVAYLENKGVQLEVIKYLDNPFTEASLQELMALLNIPPLALVRKNEAVWKNNYKGKKLTDTEIIQAMVANPKLIERPIVVHQNKAVVARPIENIEAIL